MDTDLYDEIRDHLDRRATDLEARGLTRTDAEEKARKAFGNVTRLREDSRELKLWAVLDDTVQDVRYACRGLLRSTAFAATAIISLSLAIGANTAIFSIVHAAILKPLPVPRPDRLFTLTTSEPDQPGAPAAGMGNLFSYPLWQQLRAGCGNLGRLALFDGPNRVEAQSAGPDGPWEEVTQQFVSPDAFEVLGVPPSAGQLFSLSEDRFPSPRTAAVVSYDYWRRRFGGDPGVVGQRIIITGRTFSIIGVAGKGFSGTEPGKFVDVWLPITLTDPGIFTNPEFRQFRLLGRMAPGATFQELAARLQPTFYNHQSQRAATGLTMPAAMQEQYRSMTVAVEDGSSGVSAFRRTFSRPLWILLGVAICILLIACANVASLLLARSTARAAEMALRVSLGARRSRLVRQLLTESLLIAGTAGMGGWVLARIGAPLLVAMVSNQKDPVRLDLTLDPRPLLFCITLCALSAVFFGLLPALQSSRAQPMLALRHAAGQAGRLHLGRLFVAVQVAFAFSLITCGAGFLFTLRNLAAVDTGFVSKGVTVLTVTNSLGYEQRDRQLALMHQLRLRAGALPNVQGAAAAWMPVFSGGRRAQRIIVPGKPVSDREEIFYRISPGYFATLRTPLLSGRDLEFRDNDDEPVPTIVNGAFARRYFGPGSPLGKEFHRPDGVRHQIVGLAADSRYGDLHKGPEPIAYMPMKPPRGFTLYVRSGLDAASISQMVEREAASLGSGMRVRDVTTLENLVGNTIVNERLLAGIGGVFAFLGLVLAAIGLFGLLNYSVTRRTREIGIRAALGASRFKIYGLVLRDLIGMIAGGLSMGFAGSMAAMYFARSMFFGLQPFDPLVIGTATAVFLGAALIAGGLPARRAAAIDPVVALRYE